MALRLVEQVAIIFLLLGVGIFTRKKNILTLEACKTFCNFVLVIITPALLVNCFQRDLEVELFKAMGASVVFATLFHIIAIVVTKFVFPARENGDDTVERLAAICSNCGYMGIPLMVAAIGEIGLLYSACFIVVFTVYQWSHGIMILRRDKVIHWKEILTSPGILGTVVGLILFFIQLQLPSFLAQTFDYIAGMNTPLPTIITGVFIADVSIRDIIVNKRVYLVAAMRLVILPLIFLAVLVVIRASHWFPGADLVALASIISCFCPCGISSVLLPSRYGGNVPLGASVVAVSTLLSIITVPVVVTIAEFALAL